jgi:hypothetical protein
MKLLIVHLIPLSLHPSLVQIFSLEPCSQTPSVYALPLMWDTNCNVYRSCNWDLTSYNFQTKMFSFLCCAGHNSQIFAIHLLSAESSFFPLLTVVLNFNLISLQSMYECYWILLFCCSREKELHSVTGQMVSNICCYINMHSQVYVLLKYSYGFLCLFQSLAVFFKLVCSGFEEKASPKLYQTLNT